MQTSVRQIHVSSGTSYFLRLDWSGHDLGSGFGLLLTDAQDAWRGEVTEAAICDEAEELEMEKEKYVRDLHRALTEADGSTTYSFTLSSSAAGVTLAYEKVQKDISFRLGCAELTALPDPTEAVRDLLVYSLQKGQTLERHNHKLEEQNQRLRQEHGRITADMKRYSSGKEELEAELYSRFVLVLNEKKAKIRSLQQILQNARSSNEKSGKESNHTAHREHSDEDEYGGSTEEESEEPQPTPVVKGPAEECTTPGPLDDLNDLTDVAPCRKRRFRHLERPSAQQPKAQASKKTSRELPAAASKEQTPHRPADASAATSDAEDLFEDF